MSGYTVKTAPKPKGEGWRKCPSVTYGGAKYFWFRRLPDRLEWYTYDRIAKEWINREEVF